LAFVANMHRGEAVEDVVIVGAGLAGLATALGLHRYGNTHVHLLVSARMSCGGADPNLAGSTGKSDPRVRELVRRAGKG
jgi:2-polyprenyl-6-methoxyphenol hydroxylase-like FAD-dependent oxidoreductase